MSWPRGRLVRVGVTAAAALLLVLLGWHYWALYSGLDSARGELLAAQHDLRDLGLDVTAEDLARARERLEAAGSDFDRARTHFDRDPALQVGRHLPLIGGQIDAADEFLTMGDLLAQLGLEAVDLGEAAVRVRDQEPGEQPLTVTAVQLLEDISPQLDRMDALLDELVERRLAIGDRGLIGPLGNARATLDEELPGIANGVERAIFARDLLPGLLGFNGERRYFLIAQNNAELFPGGGLISAAAILPVTHGVAGEIDVTDTGALKALWDEKVGEYIEPPGPLQRYLLKDFAWNLPTSNWSPDFPTWSQQTLEFYELMFGPQDVDGIIAVDLDVMRRLLEVTGPKSVEAEGYGDVTFDADNAILELERVTRQPFEEAENRKSVIGDLAAQLIEDVLRLAPEKRSSFITVLGELGDQRHLQLLSFDAHEQTLLRDLGWGGHLLQPTGDFMHFNEASLNSTKLNIVIQPEARYHIDLTELGDARHELEITYRNTLPEWEVGKDPDLVQQLMLDGLYGGYLRVFTPPGAVQFEAFFDGQPVPIEDLGSDAGRDWFGVFMSLPKGEERVVTLRWSVPLATTAPHAEAYDLFIQKQPGTAGMCLDLSVSRVGEPPRELEISGGSEREDGRVCLTTDIELHARF